MEVDEPSIAALASDRCESEGESASSPEFFLGDLPHASIDGLGRGPGGDPARAKAYLGSLYVSGYFGGIWLRDALGEAGEDEGGRGVAGRSSPFERVVFDAMAADAAHRLALAREGAPQAVLDAARRSVPLLLVLFGYNRGYVDVALENPPEGETAPDDLIECESFLDCRSRRIELDALDRHEAALAKLEDPRTSRWAEMAAEVDRWGTPSVASGRAVWEAILGDTAIDPAAYGALLDLSAGYLLVTEAAVLASMTGWAETEAVAARSATLIEAGLLVWSESYFMGLASPAPPGTFPRLVCEPRAVLRSSVRP